MGFSQNCQKCTDKIDGGSRTEAEAKVYSWLYALAQSDKDLVFEYVGSTERGREINFCLINEISVFQDYLISAMNSN